MKTDREKYCTIDFVYCFYLVKKMNPVKIEISTKTIIVGIAVLISIWFIYQTKEVFLLLFASFIIASALYPVVDWLSKKMSRGLAVFLIYVLGFIVLATMLIPFFAILIQQAQEFIKQIPVYWSEVEHIIANMKIISQNIALIPDLQQIVSATSFIGQHIVDQSINLTVNVFTGFVAVFTLAILVLFMLMDKAELKEGDLVFFRTGRKKVISHVGVYIRNNKFAHASTSNGVMISDLDEPYYSSRYAGAGRYH